MGNAQNDLEPRGGDEKLKRTLYLCGAGNSEGVRLVLNINRDQDRWDQILLLDDDPKLHGQSRLGVEIAGPLGLLADANPETAEVASFVARTTSRRDAVRKKLESYGIPFATLIHPRVDTLGAEYAQDTVVYENATLAPECFLGEGSVAFMGAVVGHESTVGRGCVLAAGSVLNARVQLGDGVYVGTNASILPEIKVGAGATIGANTLVIEDVPEGATILGVPGQVVGRPTRPEPERGPAPTQKTDPQLQQTIAGIWESLLAKKVGHADNFFDLGGDSLLALQLVRRIEEGTGFTLALTDLFRYPTVRSLSDSLSSRGHGAVSAQIATRSEKRREQATRLRKRRGKAAAGPRNAPQ